MIDDFRKLWAEIRANKLAVAFVLLMLCLMASFLTAHNYHGKLLDPPTAGQFGDLISGVFGPTFSLIGIFFLVVTLREQRQATQAQTKAARLQEVSDEVQEFESRYFQLLRMHRQNVSEMQLGRGENVRQGRKVFVAILDELKVALKVVRQSVAIMDPSISSLEQLQVAYYAVFFGIGSNSATQMREALEATDGRLSSKQLDFIEGELSKHAKIASYGYFAGHQSRLGHYYRHLYQTISYISAQVVLNKYDYAKTVRAQLSTHEQALLLVNSLTPIGWKWWSEGFLIDYKMVKNIPKGFMEEYCSFVPTEVIANPQYFEWQESKVRPVELESFALTEFE